MKELKTSMDTIRRTAGEMIDELSEKIRERNVERKKELEEEQKKELIPAMEAAGYRFQEKEGQMLRIEAMMLPMRKRWKILQKLPWKK